MGITLIFSCIRRLWLFGGGGGFKVLNFNIFWVFRKMIFFGVLRFCGFFLGVITILDYIKGPFLCILGSFLIPMYRMGNMFLVAKI